MSFWQDYFWKLKNLYKNWGAWLLVFMVISGGRTPKGKVIAIIFLVIFMPIFQMMFRFEPKDSEKNVSEDSADQ